jgi:hypothetical protein
MNTIAEFEEVNPEEKQTILETLLFEYAKLAGHDDTYKRACGVLLPRLIITTDRAKE